MKNNTLIEIKNISKHFPVKNGVWNKTSGYVRAVDNISFSVDEGETLGLVGESGCGKTTLGRCIVRGIKATSGEMIYRKNNGEQIDFLKLNRKDLKTLRKDIQMIFQDTNSSLDPRMTVYDIIAEPLKVNSLGSEKEINDRVKYLADVVGLNLKHLKRYPHAFSGGQRQRIGIARALAPNPRVIVADEAVSALDVSVQAQVLNLMKDLQKEFNLTYLFVAHDLSVVEHICDRVAVMYMGNLIEQSKTSNIFETPKHPYSAALMSAVPKPDPRNKMKRIILEGEVPNPANPPSGCTFHPRCQYAKDICRKKKPEFRDIGSGHFAACHFAGELNLGGVGKS